MGLITGGHEHDLFAFFLQTNRWFVLGTIHQCDQNHAAVRSTNCRLSGVRWVQGNVFFLIVELCHVTAKQTLFALKQTLILQMVLQISDSNVFLQTHPTR